MSVVDQTRHLIAQTNQQENYKFCPNCDCVLRPKVSDVVMVSPNTGHKYRALHMICNTCGHTQEADPLDHRVSRTEFRPFGSQLQEIVSRALIHDLTVRRRKPEICKNCDEMTIAVELHTRHADSMKLWLMCTNCEFVWDFQDIVQPAESIAEIPDEFKEF